MHGDVSWQRRRPAGSCRPGLAGMPLPFEQGPGRVWQCSCSCRGRCPPQEPPIALTKTLQRVTYVALLPAPRSMSNETSRAVIAPTSSSAARQRLQKNCGGAVLRNERRAWVSPPCAHAPAVPRGPSRLEYSTRRTGDGSAPRGSSSAGATFPAAAARSCQIEPRAIESERIIGAPPAGDNIKAENTAWSLVLCPDRQGGCAKRGKRAKR